MQIHSVRTEEQARQLMDLPIRFTEMFLALTLQAFARVQPLGNSIIQKDDMVMKIIDFWQTLKTGDLKKIPGLS